MATVPIIRPTGHTDSGAKLLLVIAALVVAAWAGAILVSGWLLIGP